MPQPRRSVGVNGVPSRPPGVGRFREGAHVGVGRTIAARERGAFMEGPPGGVEAALASMDLSTQPRAELRPPRAFFRVGCRG
jgi:hypothetical protein